jgi:negative modulator of initiation of replication
MKKLELSDDLYAALEQLAAAKQLSPADLIAALVHPPQSSLSGDHLLFFLARDEFMRLADPIDRYLALLAWAARNYAADFGDFISHQDSGRHYLAWNREEINEARARNHARQIDGTQYWAVLTIDDSTRLRFVTRLLEFIGCHDETVKLACRAIGFGADGAKRQTA